MSQPLFDPSPLITDRHNVVMAAGTDIVEAVDDPGDAKTHSLPTQNTHTSVPVYRGLPYQDHNYGQPPPPTPPQSPPPTPGSIPALPLTNLFDNSNANITPPEDNADSVKDEGVTRCICKFDHDDGYMICCDKCLVWQHVECMGLDRNNIPDVYFCERCEPRMVNQQRAVDLQAVKRKHILERLDSSEDEMKRKNKKTRYSAIPTTPTSLTLTSTKTKNKLKKKKKKKEKEKREREKEKERHKEGDKEKSKQEGKHHKKKKKKKRKHKKNRGLAEPGIGDLLLHGEQVLESADHFVEAVSNQYSSELNQLLFTHRQNPASSMPSPGCVMEDLSPQKILLGPVGRTARGLVATEELAPNQPIVEYRGMLMLRDQFVPTNGWTKKPYLHVLVYTKYNNIELCVDARKYGNIARYVRRSCSPNAEVRHVAIDGLLRLYLFSLVEITKGTEVTVGFDFSYKDCSHPVRCACAKKNCPVKRYWRKRRALEARGQKVKSSRDHHTSSSKRMVSPLRVSLTSGNSAENRVAPVVRCKEPLDLAKETTSKPAKESRTPNQPENCPAEEPAQPAVDMSDPEHKEKVDVVAVDTAGQQEPPAEDQEPAGKEVSEPKEEEAPKRKLTREERKMEAIMKAFAKMEKQAERRQQALQRIAQSKQQDGGTGQDGKESNAGPSQQQQQQQASVTSCQESTSVGLSDSNKEDQTKMMEMKSKDDLSCNTPAPQTTRKPSRKRRRSTQSSRRRSRANSLVPTSVEVSSADDDSNQAPPSLTGSDKIPSLTTTPISVVTKPILQEKTDTPLSSPSSSTKRFRFPKTKKILMNEWLNEKAFESQATKPLTIKTESLDASFGSSIPSPNTPQLQRSGSLSALVKESRSNVLESSGGLGSAKKRWLRQAMSEGNSNQESPMCNGTLSPIASPALSPNTSASSDLMTPLKKRMLRHSLADETSQQGSSSPRYEMRTGQDPLSASSSSALPDGQICDEAPILIQAKAELPTVHEEDVRKNSSIDSGLSVTTPADLDKSPIAIKAGLEERLRDFSGEEQAGRESEKEKSTDTNVETKEQPQTPYTDSKATSVAGDNNSLIKEDVAKAQESKCAVTNEVDTHHVSEKTEKTCDETDGAMCPQVERRAATPPSEKTGDAGKIDAATEGAKDAALHSCPVAAPRQSEAAPSGGLDRHSEAALLNKVEDPKGQSQVDPLRSERLNTLYVNTCRTRHVSGPGAMQGYHDQPQPLTLNTSFSDDSNLTNNSSCTPFSPKKRLLRQNTDPSDHREAGPSMASSWPQQSFGLSQKYSPRLGEEVHGPNQPGNFYQKDPNSMGLSGSTAGHLASRLSPNNLSASWSPGLRPGLNGAAAPQKTLDPQLSTPSPSPSPGPPLSSAPPPPHGILKTAIAPTTAVRNLGSSLSAVAGVPQKDSSEVGTAQPTSSSNSSSPISSAPNSAQSTPVKKKVSLHEYRQRKNSSAKPTSSSSSSASSSSPSTTTTASSTSITASLAGTTSTTGSTPKLSLITLPNIPLPDIPPIDPLKSGTAKKSSKGMPSPPPPAVASAPKGSGKLIGSPRKGENGGSRSSGQPPKPSNPAQSGFAIFSTKTSDGQKPTLTLTNEAQQVINSITSLLMEDSHASNGDVKDRCIRRSDSVPGESRHARKNYQDKLWEQDGRGDATSTLKRPLSPEPPPPPPGKKLRTGPIPPPPPPKGASVRDGRPGENGSGLPHRQNSVHPATLTASMAASSPMKNVSGNTMVPAQYGIAHRNQNQQFPMQFAQQQPPPQQQQQQQQFPPNAYHQHPTQVQTPQIPQQQVPQQAARPVLPPQKHANFSYPYGNQPAENTASQGFSAQQRPAYPHMTYSQNQNQHANHYGVQAKFPTNGRKSPYASQEQRGQHAYYGHNNTNAYSPRKNFHSQ